jgi:adenylate cyclase
MDPVSSADVFLFGRFRFDRRGGGLFDIDGTQVAVGSRALDVLGALIDRAGDLVTKDEVMDAVWPGTTVEDANLTVHISALRRVLDHGRSEGSCIQTVAGRGYRFVGGIMRHETSARSVGGSIVRPGGREATRLSLVVLPFANLSDEREQQYFADGITEDLTTDLSRLAGSFVISCNTAFTYKGRRVGAMQIGAELGVRYVLEGSVQRSGNQVRINAQLIDTETDGHVWAERFEFDTSDLPEAQNEIVGRLAGTLNTELIRDIGRRIERERTADPDARDLVMRARVLGIQTSAADERARTTIVDLLERALILDPDSVDARIQMAHIFLGAIADGFSSSIDHNQARAEQLIQEALQRDPNRAWARGVMGLLRRVQGRWAESQVEWEMTIALNPNDAWAIRQLGQTLMIQGKPGEAIPYLEKAIRLDPRAYNIFIAYHTLGRCHLFLGRIDEAVALIRKARALAPGIWEVHLLLAGALGLRGDIEEAKREIAEAVKLRPDVNSIARMRALGVTQGFGNPPFQSMAEKTIRVGLRRAGFPEE